ncbi:hypothetical protein [Chloracidobacterium aggregatum]|uniref:Uncharacterized protein n=1 Tax=Chloracidobacterium sp. N TaxID=2821540 RepID=A0ABX8B569_9BACT|nr:hypothetical protein [Chloracidobacterium aggregatum]QUV95795.1 hypothetical protein J8C05_13365 [Chloracidobacterium sp. N]
MCFAARQTLEAAAEVAALRQENQTLIHDLERYLVTLRGGLGRPGQTDRAGAG